MSEYRSLSHSKYDCKYHLVFIPKNRRRVFFGEIRKEIGEIFHELAKQKGCAIIEGHLMPDRERGTSAPLGREFIRIANISKSTVEQALRFLQKRDYAYQDDVGCYKVLDPLIAAVLEAS